MKGVLSEQPLAELIREIATKELSGVLRLELDQAKTAVYFEGGELVFAASNVRSLRLRAYLTKRNLVSEDVLAPMGGELTDQKLAELLCGIGKLKEEYLDGLFTSMVADTVRVALLWTEGTWEFDERTRFNDSHRVSIDTVTLLRETAQRLPLKFVSDRFRNPKEIISPAPKIPELKSLLPAEGFLLSRLDTPLELEQLIAVSGLRDLDAYRIVYGLTLSGVVEREFWHHAFRAKPKSKTKVAEPVKAEPKVDEEGELRDFLSRVEKTDNWYEILDLSHQADTDEIKNAYYMLARRYHPDRFHLRTGTAMHRRISSTFARVTQAYEILANAKSRATYDATLKRLGRFAAAPSPKSWNKAAGSGQDVDRVDPSLNEAEENFRLGMSALQFGNHKEALPKLAMAARLVPDEAQYRANYGRALAGSESTRRLAEAELIAAVKLEPTNAHFLTMLADLYIQLKFYRRAQTELEKAVELDPSNIPARALLRKLEQGEISS